MPRRCLSGRRASDCRCCHHQLWNVHRGRIAICVQIDAELLSRQGGRRERHGGDAVGHQVPWEVVWYGRMRRKIHTREFPPTPPKSYTRFSRNTALGLQHWRCPNNALATDPERCVHQQPRSEECARASWLNNLSWPRGQPGLQAAAGG